MIRCRPRRFYATKPVRHRDHQQCLTRLTPLPSGEKAAYLSISFLTDGIARLSSDSVRDAGSASSLSAPVRETTPSSSASSDADRDLVTASSTDDTCGRRTRHRRSKTRKRRRSVAVCQSGCPGFQMGRGRFKKMAFSASDDKKGTNDCCWCLFLSTF